MAAALMFALLASACGGSDNGNTLPTVNNDSLASGTCLAGDPNCADGADGGAAGPLTDAIAIGDPNNPDAPLAITYGGFFYSDGTVSQLCAGLAESFPPQCADVVIEVVAPFDDVLAHVAESFGNPDTAKINRDEGIYWTDDWVNLSGILQNDRLVLDS